MTGFLKKAALVLAAACVLAVCSVSLAAELSTEITAGSGTDTVELSLTGAEDAVAMQFVLTYDASKVRLTNSSVGGAFSGLSAPVINTNTPGEIVFLWDAVNPINASGVLASFEFEPLYANVSAELEVAQNEEFILVNSEYAEIDCTLSMASAPVPAAPGASASPAETAAPTNSPDAADDTAGGATDAPGQSAAPETGAIDANGNGTLSVGDEVAIESAQNSAWFSSDPDVATVVDGRIVAVGEGTATVTVIGADGTTETTYTVEVLPTDSGLSPAAIAGIAVAGAAVLGAAAFILYKVFIKDRAVENGAKRDE